MLSEECWQIVEGFFFGSESWLDMIKTSVRMNVAALLRTMTAHGEGDADRDDKGQRTSEKQKQPDHDSPFETK